MTILKLERVASTTQILQWDIGLPGGGNQLFIVRILNISPDRLDENVYELALNADVLIYDAMYTDEEYHNPKSPKVGWGHSTWQEAVKNGSGGGGKTSGDFSSRSCSQR